MHHKLPALLFYKGTEWICMLGKYCKFITLQMMETNQSLLLWSDRLTGAAFSFSHLLVWWMHVIVDQCGLRHYQPLSWTPVLCLLYRCFCSFQKSLVFWSHDFIFGVGSMSFKKWWKGTFLHIHSNAMKIFLFCITIKLKNMLNLLRFICSSTLCLHAAMWP